MTDTSIPVAMIDDHEMVREGMALLIDTVPGMHVVAHAADAESVIRLVGNRVPRVLLVEANLDWPSAFDVMATIRDRWPAIARILVGDRLSDEIIDRALSVRIEGIADKRDDFDTAVRAIRNVARGSRCYPRAMTECMAAGVNSWNSQALQLRKFPILTRREQQIVRYLVDGNTVKKIAHRLNLSPSTIDKHKTNLMRKLGVHSTVQLTRYAIREGFVRP